MDVLYAVDGMDVLGLAGVFFFSAGALFLSCVGLVGWYAKLEFRSGAAKF
jgi:hypothetical protein